MESRYVNLHPRESFFRSSSMSTGLNNIHPTGAGGGTLNRQQPAFYGSMDMSVIGNGIHSNRQSILSSTPLARRLMEAANTSQITSNGNGHCQSSQPSAGQSGGYFQDGSFGRPTASIGGLNSLDRMSTGVFTTFAQPATITQDPRSLNSSEFQRNVAANLFQFLQKHNFDWKQPNGKSGLSEKALCPVSQKTFERVFEFLMKVLLGKQYSLENKKFEAEVITQASVLGYPFANGLKPNVLKAPNIQGAVPIVCGFLDWLREEAETWEVITGISDKDAENGPSFIKLFFRPDDGMENNNMNIENVFHNARLNFMTETYRRFQQNPSADDIYTEDVLAQFQNQLNACVGVSEDMSEMSAELEHRGAAYREKVANYESVEKSRARLEESEARITQSKKAYDEQKCIINRTEHDLMRFATDERKVDQDNQQISRQIEDVQKQIRRQKISREEHLEILAKQEELRNQIRQANDELENLNRLIGKRKQNQQRYCAKLQDSVQSLKLGLVQIDDTASLEKFSDYAVDQDVIAYVVDVKEEVSRIIMCLRSRSEGVRATIQKAKTDLADLEKKREPLLSKLLKIAENEKIVRLELETLDKVNDTSNIVNGLENRERILVVEIETVHGDCEAAKTALQNGEHHHAKFTKGQKQIKDAIALRKAADDRLRKEHVAKQQSRCAHLDQILTNIESDGNLAEQAVDDLQSSMLDAMQGGREQK